MMGSEIDDTVGSRPDNLAVMTSGGDDSVY